MKIKIHFLGILANFFQADATELDLPGTPTLKDLLVKVGIQYGDLLPPEIWDREKKIFLSTLFIRGKGRDLRIPEESLLDGEEVYFLLPQAGG